MGEKTELMLSRYEQTDVGGHMGTMRWRKEEEMEVKMEVKEGKIGA